MDSVETRPGIGEMVVRLGIGVALISNISDICRIMRIFALMRIGKFIRMANPSVK